MRALRVAESAAGKTACFVSQSVTFGSCALAPINNDVAPSGSFVFFVTYREGERKMTQHGTLPLNSPIADRIAGVYASLTPALRTLADFILAEPLRAARLSIHAVSEELGISSASANRFAKTLGFAGYHEFRGELIRGFEPMLEPVARLGAALQRARSGPDIVRASLEDTVHNIQATIRQLSTQAVDEATRRIVSAQHCFVIGFDGTGPLAALLASGLDLYRRNVSSSSHGNMLDASRKLFRFGPKDVVIAIAFRRYLKATIDLARAAHEHGIPVIAITDGPRSPLARFADTVVYAHAETEYNVVSNATILALLEAIVMSVARQSKTAVDDAERFAAFSRPWMLLGPDDE